MSKSTDLEEAQQLLDLLPKLVDHIAIATNLPPPTHYTNVTVPLCMSGLINFDGNKHRHRAERFVQATFLKSVGVSNGEIEELLTHDYLKTTKLTEVTSEITTKIQSTLQQPDSSRVTSTLTCCENKYCRFKDNDNRVNSCIQEMATRAYITDIEDLLLKASALGATPSSQTNLITVYKLKKK
jgi:hypothetical protein